MIVSPDPTLPDVLVLQPRTHRDDRGVFQEIYQASRYVDAGIDRPFVQDNRSLSHHGVLRGLHFQHPRPQGKLVMSVAGEVLDVAVDIRVGSPTFGRWCAYRLSAEEGRQIWIPPGFAHGFVVLSESAQIVYKCTAPYDSTCEHTLLWSDAGLGIDWPVVEPVLSEKDREGSTLEELKLLGCLPGTRQRVVEASGVQPTR